MASLGPSRLPQPQGSPKPVTAPFQLYFLTTFWIYLSLVAAVDFCLDRSLLLPALGKVGTRELTRAAVTMTTAAVTVA